MNDEDFDPYPDGEDMDEGGYCPQCCGSGEGMYEGSCCGACGGSGEISSGPSREDYEADRAEYLNDLAKDERDDYR
jgi:hypothetical protein